MYKNQIALFAIMSALLSACATGMSEKQRVAFRADVMTSVSNNETGALLIDSDGQRCDVTSFVFINSKGKKSDIYGVFKDKEGGTTPVLVSLKPGKYQLSKGTCRVHGFEPLKYKFFDEWFDTVLVEAGTVKYLGNLKVTAVKAAVPRDVTNRVLSSVIAFDFAKADIVQYPAFDITDGSEEAKMFLDEYYPKLSSLFADEKIKTHVSSNEFKQVIKDAYSEENRSQSFKLVKEFMSSLGTEVSTSQK